MPNNRYTGEMTSRQRFREVMRYGTFDRIPRFEEGIREDVIDVWRNQGLPKHGDLSRVFNYDQRIEIQLNLDPLPELKQWPTSRADLDTFQKHLDPDNPKRYPKRWEKLVKTCKESEAAVMLRAHNGLFLSMGVNGWSRFSEVMDLILDEPELVCEMMMIQSEFACKLAENVLGEIEVDAVIFSEPIGGNDKPLISPKMYENLVLKTYEPVFKLIKQHDIETIIFRTYANARALIPSIIKWGFNCVWACEASLESMDYNQMRREFGKELRFMGGIDLNVLRFDQATIRKEVETKVPALLAQGGYVPLADGRVRQDVPFENYVYYRQVLDELTG